MNMVNLSLNKLNNMKEKHKYIVPHKNGCFQVQIWFSGKQNYLGLYKTIEEAIKVRDKFLKENAALNQSKTYNSYYFDNIKAYKQITYSLAVGKLDRELFLSLLKIVDGVSKKFRYENEDDRLDCRAYAIEVIIKNWMHFNPDKYDNVFSYMTEIVKRAYAFQWKQLQKTRINTISLDYISEDGEKMINL